MKPEITMERFEEILPLICDRETSSDPKNWTPENPLWGHCAVVALIAQNLFGGKLARASLQDTEFHRLHSHYWNLFPDGAARDFTSSQFQGQKLILTVSEVVRSYVLSPKFPDTIRRYKLLAFRLARALNPTNPLFDDLFYKPCFHNALNSPCQKMKFGCVVRYNPKNDPEIIYEIVYEGYNKTIEPLRSLCEPTCIRFNIPSRTESMIGACGHAEEMALWGAIKKCVPLDECEMYVAGVYSNGLPYVKNELEFTCLRCAVQIYYSEIKKVWVPVVDRWEALTGEECVKTARAYATKEKVIS